MAKMIQLDSSQSQLEKLRILRKQIYLIMTSDCFFFSDNSTQIEDSKHDGEIATESENRTEIKVLPPSDTTELVKLVRNNKSTASLEPEKGKIYFNINLHNKVHQR